MSTNTEPLRLAVERLCSQTGESPDEFERWLCDGGLSQMALSHFTAASATQAEPAGPISADVRAALLFALWHHQGSSSRVGQPIRSMLGIRQHERMSVEQYDIARKMQSALAAPAAAPEVPEGWQLVPKEPTWEMVLAATKLESEARIVENDCIGFSTSYRAMLAAAPQPEGRKS